MLEKKLIESTINYSLLLLLFVLFVLFVPFSFTEKISDILAELIISKFQLKIDGF